MKMLTGKDYPHLCKHCRSEIDRAYSMLKIDSTIMTGFYSYDDDDEAPCNLAYDRGWLKGENCTCDEPKQFVIKVNEETQVEVPELFYNIEECIEWVVAQLKPEVRERAHVLTNGYKVDDQFVEIIEQTND